MKGMGKYVNFISMLRKHSMARLLHVFLYICRKIISQDRPPYPLFGIIGITDNCNLKCRMCPRLSPIKKDGLSEMRFEQFKKIIDEVHFLRISLIGFGEPLLHKDILRMIDYAKSKNIRVHITTNGTLIDKRMALRIVSSKVDQLSFSIDGATPKTLESIRVGVNFNELIRNVKRMVKVKKEKKSPIQLCFRQVLMKENVHELPALIELAHKLGIPKVLTQDVVYTHETYLKSEHALRALSRKEKMKIRKIFKKAKYYAKKYNIELTLPRLNQVKEWTSCKEPWNSLLVTSNGFVTPCCGVTDIFFGNVFKENPLKIWNNRKFVEWRTRMRSNDPPESCKGCGRF
jgi:radical SAM protein with 4Fe4S-binding SPASM domain